MKGRSLILDGNEAVAGIAYKLSEVITIYPITPSSPMGEFSDAWASEDKKNIWGTIPSVVEMQSEGGAAGALHGSLTTGSLTTTFTASQGLLLMLPNMFKIAGELTSNVIHVAARSLAAQGLSIFGDHSDVMACRSTGYVFLASDSVESARDMALISHAVSLEARLPFLHFFDGFRTSHEVMKIPDLDDSVIKEMVDSLSVIKHRNRGLTPDNPAIRGTAQNPDVYFQARETVNPYYEKVPSLVSDKMKKLNELIGKDYKPFEYFGADDAESIIVIMGSGGETVRETVDWMVAQGEKVGMVKVRLYRPFSIEYFFEVLPKTIKKVSVLDRVKEPGSLGEPLFQDILQAYYELFSSGKIKEIPILNAGRYGLSSKEFTPAMVYAIFENLKKDNPIKKFTIGIEDDLNCISLNYDKNFDIENPKTFRARFYGLGADGTVGANKNSIKIIGQYTENFAQGYFVYDSKKSGSMTVSHLRFGETPIHSEYLVYTPNFVACHQTIFLDKIEMLNGIKQGGTFLLNTHYSVEEIWSKLPGKVQKEILDKKLEFYIIDGLKVARETGMKNQINTIMQTCFFAISGVLPKEKALDAIRDSIKKTYGKKGEEIVRRNLEAVDSTLSNLHKIEIEKYRNEKLNINTYISPMQNNSPEFVSDVLSLMALGKGDDIPVSKLPNDGTYPVGTTKYEKRNIASEIPVWDEKTCIQCGKCSFVCPHAVIRVNVLDPKSLENSPEGFVSVDSRIPEFQGKKFTLQISPEDCTGCGICVDICPAKNKSEARLKAINMYPKPDDLEKEKRNWNHFTELPPIDRNLLKITSIRQEQLQEPLFEFSGACSGCGETPYIKLATQLFGDRMLIANATGCSSIYGGNLPTTPYTKNKEGRGPAWSNSLFEDNAEFGLGYRVSLDKQVEFALELLEKYKNKIGEDLVNSIISADQSDEPGIFEQRVWISELKKVLEKLLPSSEENEKIDLLNLQSLTDKLVKKSIWIIGGDGWAYDIGFGGLDHVLASGRNVNILILDTEVYSNTGGQMSKATPRAAVAKFAAGGKKMNKKDIGLIAMSYGDVYVGSVAMGARDEHTLKTFLEAESFNGPSIIIAYSHCIAHGINMQEGMRHQKAAVESGQWLLYRYDPRKKYNGENPLSLDFKSPKIPLEKYMYSQNRFKMLTKSKPSDAKRLLKEATENNKERLEYYEYLSNKGQEKKED
ncbi:MAG: pyruvate:ferredoxin (flavodoxin) oxidoreductase [Leptospiraceae bacterium]|nr:pyruvate:ferredoxin (flavodoxin) oxidoreductase [Leptospiraceae bacterium]